MTESPTRDRCSRRWLAAALLVACLPAGGCGLFAAAGKFLADEFYVLDAAPPEGPRHEGDPWLHADPPALPPSPRDLRR